ncbi:MAG: hypothetical protein E7275_05905 [Pseudobutyrivibrio sp.]|uniref:hypothetical protein n=1 Tax=Pseudobutyrivibrio sp. TaxID=2014367 RepID=UPI0025EB3EEC|nr:hypothetical protein [Pseudobutyrivibrio sp.]MBE5903807.1 hypothetical protein [Pseudobutyrivibrio sp.]
MRVGALECVVKLYWKVMEHPLIRRWRYLVHGVRVDILEHMENGDKYIRKIESMGEGLLFFEISIKEKSVGQNCHILYENGKKPPLDIAINGNNKIEYVSYFLQDEKLEHRKIELENIGEYNENVFSEVFNPKDNYYISYNCDFNYWIDGDIIWVVRSDNSCNKIKELHVTSLDSLIFAGDEFIGFKLDAIRENEKDEIIRSKCI